MLAWIVNTGISAVGGLAVGAAVVSAQHALPRRRGTPAAGH